MRLEGGGERERVSVRVLGGDQRCKTASGRAVGEKASGGGGKTAVGEKAVGEKAGGGGGWWYMGMCVYVYVWIGRWVSVQTHELRL